MQTIYRAKQVQAGCSNSTSLRQRPSKNTGENAETIRDHCLGVGGQSHSVHLRQFSPVTHYVLSSCTFNLQVWTSESGPGSIPSERVQIVTESDIFLIILSSINLGSSQFLSMLSDRAISTLLKA